MKNAPLKTYWIYGIHAVKEALANNQRDCHQFLVMPELFSQFEELLSKKPECQVSLSSRPQISQKIGNDIVHQGCALKVTALLEVHLEEIFKDPSPSALIMILDQVTDPHNVGAVLRSCAAFGAKALILPERNAPPEENGVLAKTASGAFEHVPLISVSNLARTLETLKAHDYWCIGLDERGDKAIHQLDLTGKNAVVMGAEGEGLRRLTREKCDFLVRLPTSPAFPTLNVSNAAAISLYQFAILNNSV